jgi:hypothetical protein
MPRVDARLLEWVARQFYPTGARIGCVRLVNGRQKGCVVLVAQPTLLGEPAVI